MKLIKRRPLLLNKILLVLTAILITTGYGISLTKSQTFQPNLFSVVRAEGPSSVIDTNEMAVTSEYVQGFTAQIQDDIAVAKSNIPEVLKIKNYLTKRGASLAGSAEIFVAVAKEYNLPYNLMPAISVIESGGGKATYRPYNYAGLGGQSNAMTFANWEEAIRKHAQILRKGYFDKGADTPEEIEKYYCYQCPTWGEKVTGVMRAIDNTAY